MVGKEEERKSYFLGGLGKGFVEGDELGLRFWRWKLEHGYADDLGGHGLLRGKRSRVVENPKSGIGLQDVAYVERLNFKV